MALTRDQFQRLRDRGLSVEQIVKFESGETPEQTINRQTTAQKLGDVLVGVSKGVVSTLTGAATLGERGLRGATKTLLPKVAERKLGIEEKEFEPAAERLIPKEIRTPEGVAEKVGFTTEQIGEFFIPGGVLTKGAKVGVLRRGIKEATEFAGRTALQKGEVDKEVGVAAGLGAVSPVLGKAFGVVGEQLKLLPDRFIQSALRKSKKELLSEFNKKPSETLAQFVLKQKKVRTANNLVKESQEEISKLSSQINENLKRVKITKDKISVKQILKQVVDDINATGGSISEQEVRTIITRLAPQSKGLLQKPSMGLFNANKLRQSLDRTLGDRGFLTAELPFNKEVLRKFDNALRNTVKEKAPVNKPIFDTLSKEIRLRDSLLERIAEKGGNQVLSFGDFIGGGLGGIFGGGLPGAIAGVATRRAIESVPFKIGAGKFVDQLNQILPILKKLEPAERGIIAQLLQGEKFD